MQGMPDVRRGLFRFSKLKVIHAQNDIEIGQVRPFTERVAQIAGRCIIIEEALVSEAEIDFSLEKARIQSENLLEFFRCEDKIALPESGLARVKRCFDLLL